MLARLRSRLIGVLLLAGGAGVVVWCWQERHSGRLGFPGGATWGLMLIGVALWVVSEAPPIPPGEFNKRGRAVSVIALFAGIVLELLLIRAFPLSR
jgi:hypothetical protein